MISILIKKENKMGGLIDIYGNPITVTNTPETYNNREAAGADNDKTDVAVQQNPERKPADENYGYEQELNSFYEDISNGTPFMDAVSKQLYRMPTEEEQKRIDRRNKARTVIAGVADALRVLGQGIAASGGGTVNLDRGSLSDANNARYDYYKKEHADKLARNNQMLIDADINDYKNRQNGRINLLRMMAEDRYNKIRKQMNEDNLRYGLAEKKLEMAQKSKESEADRKYKQEENEKNRENDLQIAKIRTYGSGKSGGSGSGNSGADKSRRMIFDNETVVFPNENSMTDLNRRFIGSYMDMAKVYMYGDEIKDINSVGSDRMAQIVQKLLDDNPQIKQEYLRYADREGYNIRNHSVEEDELQAGGQENALERLANVDSRNIIYPYAPGRQPDQENEYEYFKNYIIK